MQTEQELIERDIEAYLAQHERKELLRLLTCGSVDDGKSTLIGRLLHDSKMVYEDQMAAVTRDSAKKSSAGGEVDLSLLVDGLKEERMQGITIDVAYRYFSTAKRKFIIADCPGHEQYTRNMATGASTCNLAIILIDARHGVMQQTRRHSFIVSLLGIKHVVIAVNKMDLVDFSQARFEEIKREYTEFVTKLEMGDLTFIPVSALKGDNVVDASTNMPWFQGGTLMHYLETVHIASDRNLIDFRLPVQYVNRPNLDFRGFSGTIASGIVRKGDEVISIPSGRKSRVARIVTFDGDLDEAFAPQSVTLTLTDEIDCGRGDMLVHPANLPRVDRSFEAMVVWMIDQPLAPGKQYLIKQATKVAQGTCEVMRYRVDVNSLHRQEAPELKMNEVGRCKITLTSPVAFDPYRKNRNTGAFIFIDRLTNATVGAGMIIDRESTLGGFGADLWDVVEAENRKPQSVHPVELAERTTRAGHNSATILLTGLTGAGKSTTAYALERRLFDADKNVYVLDGENMRHGISKGLGFSAWERSENLRRSIEVAKILNDAGVISICAFLAPDEAIRDKARETVGGDRFLEVYLKAPADVLRKRDPAGMYAKADSGEIAEFPGVSAKYDEPKSPDLTLETDKLTTAQCVDQIIALLERRKLI
ncbi:MAG: bifunctional sulfate adenylyltransferase subunit 1/adenylylsulfate kinase [Pirellula sp.]|nr:bifunctional sulfate adenylyltransferase subunit 1/adenylylsulfate kinase [Pirellula sp.]